MGTPRAAQLESAYVGRSLMLDALTVVSVALGILVLAISIRSWRFGVYGLLCFIPFAGIPTILLHPAPPATRLLKDVLFVVPAYIGFVAWYMRKPPREKVPFVVLAPALLLTALVLMHMFRTDLMVALVGLKIWVLYLPLIVLGYHLVGTIGDLDKLGRWLLAMAAVPIALGVIQGVLISAGASDLAYGAYGEAAADVTHGFGRTEVGTGDVAKVASTFTFVSQYYNFVLATLCIAYARWRSMPRRSATRFWFGMAPLAVVTLAGFLTGSRGAFVMIPLFFIVVLVLTADWVGLVQVGALLVAGMTTALALFNTTFGDLFGVVQELSVDYLTFTQLGEFRTALATTLWGLGTGTNTGPARFVTPDETTVTLENYYAKAVMELGLLGLTAVVLLFMTILVVGFRRTHALKDPIAKAYANSFLAFLIISIINGWKASYLDIDPLNVYFWLYAGLLLRIPTMALAHTPSFARVKQSSLARRLRRPTSVRGLGVRDRIPSSG
jgi:hypothetical protein